MTVAEAFCARHKCPPAHFEERVLRLCLYSRALPLRFLLTTLNPNIFHEDKLLVQQVGLAQTLEGVDAALRDFQYVNHARPHWLRTGLKIRISGRKMKDLAESLLTTQEPAAGPSLPDLVNTQSRPTR